MATRTDSRFEALRGLGYVGAVSDMMLQWYQAGGATSKDLSTARREFLDVAGQVAPQVNDAWMNYMSSQGFTQSSISDRESAFWFSLTLVPEPLDSWDASFAVSFGDNI